jgi:hypothetical protein
MHKINNDVICAVRGVFCQRIEDHEKEKARRFTKVYVKGYQPTVKSKRNAKQATNNLTEWNYISRRMW